MSGRLFGERQMLVVGENYLPQIHGKTVRERLRAKLSLLTSDSAEIQDAAHLGTAYLGNENLPPHTLLEATRERFRIASKPFSRPIRSGGDLTGVDA